MKEADVNCIGYVAHKLGFDRVERFIPPPGLEEVLAVHDEVPDISTAEVIGIVRPTGNDYHTGPTVCHMAMVEPGEMIGHRKEHGAEATHEPFAEGLRDYLKRPDVFKIIYLVRKV